MSSAREAETGAENDNQADRATTLSPAARRALAEAEERRRNIAENSSSNSRDDGQEEIGGQDGPEPTRYGDWEKGGITSDF